MLSYFILKKKNQNGYKKQKEKKSKNLNMRVWVQAENNLVRRTFLKIGLNRCYYKIFDYIHTNEHWAILCLSEG